MTIPSLLNDYSTITIKEDGKIEDIEMSAPEKEDGAIGKKIQIPQSVASTSTISVYRINTLTLECIKVINQQSIQFGEIFSFKDYSVEMGEDYQYVIGEIQNGKLKHFLNDIYPFGDTNPGYARLMRMDSAFLTTRKHQLRLQGNLKITNFKRNTSDNFQTTIGGKFPFYSRASAMNYRTFSISAAISINFDPTSSFLRLDSIGALSIGDILSYSPYNALIELSPGVAQFFTQEDEVDENGMPQWRFTGPPFGNRMSVEDCVDLVNRCARNLAMNGLWWDDDDGNSTLHIQNRDIFYSSELSLSRRRVGDTEEIEKARIEQLSSDNSVKEEDFINNKITEIARKKDGVVYDKPFYKKGQGPKTVYDDYLYRQSGLNYSTLSTDEQVFIERKFREKVMEWLSDGKPKVFRSETEGNMIVMISAPTFTALDKTNHMVYSVSMTATEIAEFNAENLMLYNLVPSDIRSIYLDENKFQFIPGQEDPNVITRLSFFYTTKYDIPSLRLNDENMEIAIPLHEGVVNGTPPFVFSAVGLPSGVSIVEKDADDLKGGTIIGYPIGNMNQDPGYVIVTITDDDGKGDTITVQIPKGYMYLPFSDIKTININSKDANKNTLLIGEEISEVNANDYFSGGLPPFRFTKIGLPTGIDVNITSGELYGRYTQEFDAGTGGIQIQDRMGQQCLIPVEYVEGRKPLTFIKLDSYDYGYTEIGVPEEDKNLAQSVSGGEGKYTFYADDPTYPLPDGWVLNSNTGVLSVTPHGSQKSRGSFIVRVEDEGGSAASVTINYDTILDAFVFATSPSIWVFPYNGALSNGQPVPSDIPMSSTLDTIGGIDVSPFVSGGLPFTSTNNPYRYEAIGLLPNWKIDQTGLITGYARIPMPAHEATIYAIDARGERRACTIKVGEVTGVLKFQHSGYNVKNLYQTKILTDDNVERKDNGSKGVLIPDSFITQGTPPYSVVANGFPDGLGIEEIPNPSTQRSSWKFIGTPTKAQAARTGWLMISDQAGNIIQVQVDFEEVYEKLTWVQKGAIPYSGAPGARFQITLSGLSGGKPKLTGGYDFVFQGVDATISKDWTISSATPDNVSTYVLSGTLPDSPNWKNDFAIIITDAVGESQTGNFSFRTTAAPMSIKFLKDYAGVTMMVNHAKVQKNQNAVMQISGGTPPYSIVKQGKAEACPGIEFVIDGDTVYCQGTPTALNNSPQNIAGSIIIMDSGVPTKSISPAFTWYPPQVVKFPHIGTDITDNQLATSAEVLEGSLFYGYYWSGHQYFQDMVFPGVQAVITSGILPSGLQFLTKNNYVTIAGTPTEKVPDAQEVILRLTTPGTVYDNSIELTVKIKWDAVAGQFDYFCDADIPAAGVGKSIGKIDISSGLSGGTGRYEWSVSPDLPANLSLKWDTSDSRKAWIEGSTAVETAPRSFTITVKDATTGQTCSSEIFYGGAFPPLVISGSTTIPEMQGTDTLSPVDISNRVSGGTEPYFFSDDDNSLLDFGYIVDEQTGIISGKANSQSKNEKIINLYVQDANGQKEPIPVKVGKITGELGFDTSIAGGPYTIPSGRKGTTKTTSLPNLYNAALGGQSPYKFSEAPNGGWKDAGFQCTMDTQGKFTKIVYPSEKKPAGSFQVILEDSLGVRINISVPYGAVID